MNAITVSENAIEAVTVEIEDETKPALTADWITIIQFDPKDRPEDV